MSKNLINLLKLSQTELFTRINQVASRINVKPYVKPGSFIVLPGTIPLTVVTHLDTAGKLPRKIQINNNIITQTSSKAVLGGDDRCGVYIALYHLLPLPYRPTLVFTCDEERGCLGTYDLCDYMNTKRGFQLYSLLTQSKFLIQLDRRGKNDCVFYNNESKEFITFIESYGFKYAIGSFSDIAILSPELDLCGTNLSVGYRYEHTAKEQINFNHVLKTANKVKRIIRGITVDSKQWVLSQNREYFYSKEEYNDWIKDRYSNSQCELCREPLLFTYEIEEKLCWNCQLDKYRIRVN